VGSLLLSLLVVLGANSFDGAVGAQACRACHSRIYHLWLKGPHAAATQRLDPAAQRDPRCTGCHGSSERPELAGVQCEACHGQGRNYAADIVMRDRALARAAGLSAIDEATCLRCHRPGAPGQPFVYAAALRRLSHGGGRP